MVAKVTPLNTSFDLSTEEAALTKIKNLVTIIVLVVVQKITSLWARLKS